MHRTDRTPSDLNRSHTLEEAYTTHDVGISHFIEECPYDVEHYGIDRREDDGGDGLIYDDKPDLRLWWEDAPIALVDVKTKTSQKWMGYYNLRHWIHYFEQQFRQGLPVFVVMYLVDNDEVKDGFYHEVGTELFQKVQSSDDPDSYVRAFPDGNEAVVVEHEHRKPLNRLDSRLEESWLQRRDDDESVPDELRVDEGPRGDS